VKKRIKNEKEVDGTSSVFYMRLKRRTRRSSLVGAAPLDKRKKGKSVVGDRWENPM